MSKIKLMHGDCLKKMDELIKSGVKIDAIITDPPYGTTACKWDTIIPFDEMWKRLKTLRKEETPIILFGSEPFSSALRMSNIKEYKYDWIWVKNLKTGNLNARKMPMKGHEEILIFYKKSATYNPQKRKRTIEVKAGNKRNSKTSVYGKQKELYTDRQSDWINPDTVIKYIKCVHNSFGKLHPTQKPVELLEYFIRTYTNENEIILDFAMGSGTTCIACINTNRDFIGIELEKEYFEIAKERIIKYIRERR